MIETSIFKSKITSNTKTTTNSIARINQAKINKPEIYYPVKSLFTRISDNKLNENSMEQLAHTLMSEILKTNFEYFSFKNLKSLNKINDSLKNINKDIEPLDSKECHILKKFIVEQIKPMSEIPKTNHKYFSSESLIKINDSFKNINKDIEPLDSRECRILKEFSAKYLSGINTDNIKEFMIAFDHVIKDKIEPSEIIGHINNFYMSNYQDYDKTFNYALNFINKPSDSIQNKILYKYLNDLKRNSNKTQKNINDTILEMDKSVIKCDEKLSAYKEHYINPIDIILPNTKTLICNTHTSYNHDDYPTILKQFDIINNCNNWTGTHYSDDIVHEDNGKRNFTTIQYHNLNTFKSTYSSKFRDNHYIIFVFHTEVNLKTIKDCIDYYEKHKTKRNLFPPIIGIQKTLNLEDKDTQELLKICKEKGFYFTLVE